MTRIVTLRLDVDDLAVAIAESIAVTLRPHRALIALHGGDGDLVRPAVEKAGAMLRELGCNVAQTVLGVGEELGPTITDTDHPGPVAMLSGAELGELMRTSQRDRRAALRFSAEQLETTGEANTRDAVLLLRQLADDES